MASTWILLIDTSGSMGNGFESTSRNPIDPLGDTGAWATKLDAAKELLLRQIANLRSQDVAIVRFSDHAEKIYQGTKDAYARIRSLVGNLEADGNTSIANAIDSITIDPTFDLYRSLSVLILTDGLSDGSSATTSAEAFVTKYPFARIDTILIDETEDGRNVAEGISINGTVRNVTSTVQLRDAITSARAAGLVNELSNMALHRFHAQQELSMFEYIASPTLLTAISDYPLTSRTIEHEIVPTIAALEDFGRAASFAKHSEYSGAVTSISHDSPISINLTGLKDSVDLALSYAIPWRRRNAERLAALELQKKEIEVKRDEHTLKTVSLDDERKKLELLKLQVEVASSKWELAEKMLKRLDPDERLNSEERERVLLRLISGIDNMSRTSLEFESIGHT